MIWVCDVAQESQQVAVGQAHRHLPEVKSAILQAVQLENRMARRFLFKCLDRCCRTDFEIGARHEMLGKILFEHGTNTGWREFFNACIPFLFAVLELNLLRGTGIVYPIHLAIRRDKILLTGLLDKGDHRRV